MRLPTALMAGVDCCKYSLFFVNCLVFIIVCYVLWTRTTFFEPWRIIWCFLLALSIMITIGGIALLAIGIWVHVGADSFKQVVSSNPIVFNAVYIIIAVGCLLIIVGFLGCCGAAKENRCMLGTFFSLLLTLFIIEIVGGALAFAFYPKAKKLALNSIKYYNDGTSKGNIIAAGWKTLQKTFQCCGINGFADWDPAIKNCQLPPAPCPHDGPDPTKPSKIPGCRKALKRYFWILGGIACSVLVIEILAMTFACCVYQNARSGFIPLP